MPLPSLPEPSSSPPPATLAAAFELEPETVLAEKPIVPSACRSRPVVASESSFTTVTAIEIPTPVSSDCVSPDALVCTLSLSEAVALKLPVIESG